MIWWFDVSKNSTGWCVGDGSQVPIAGAFQYDSVAGDYGDLGAAFLNHLGAMVGRYGMPTHIGWEDPLMLGRDKLGTVIIIYGMVFLLATWARGRGVQTHHYGHKKIKKRITGNGNATKAEVATIVAQKLRVTLPPTVAAGRHDAADAVGGWILAVDAHAPQHQPKWDAALHGCSGGSR